MPALVAALATSNGAHFDGIVTALIARRSKVGHLAVLGRWPELSPAQRSLINAARGRMAAALRDALLSDDDQLFANARDVVEASGEFDLTPTLIVVAEQPQGARSQAAMDLTMRLVALLSHMIAAAKDTQNRGDQQDLETIRRCVLESLERSVERFRQHQRSELIEAFVILAGPHSGTLKTIMEAPHHPCFPSVVQTLAESRSPGVLQMLTTILTCKEAPLVVRNVVSARTDAPFVEALLAMPRDPTNSWTAKNVARIRSLACIESLAASLGAWSAAQHAAAMRLMAATGAPDDAKLDLAQALLAGASPAGRLEACLALRSIAGQRSNELVLTALKDDDAEVQAAAVRQLRDRHIPGALAILISLIDSTREAVSRAARDSLSEFSFDNFLSQFDGLDEEARRTTGRRVARVDQQSPERLVEELVRPSRRQRLRAIDMALAMGLVSQVANTLVLCLGDDDHVVRTAAAEALQYSTASFVREALLAALADRSVAVQNAARCSLQAQGVDVALAALRAAAT